MVDARPSGSSKAESSAPAQNAATIASTFGPPRIYSVAGGAGDIPLRPGTWVGTPASPDPNVLVPCSAHQWAGDDMAEVIGVWGTPVGEDTVHFPIRDVQGSIKLSGACNWQWVGQ
ncbi:hypothetical protein JF710_11870 [Mycobacterium intracellulare]|uniref:hypothetical protein n=1 Tax=Mycobacterium intracellulare TaxID=1767 RepID=UPI001CDAD289|nr:hypothetical protein [Mycobacterium intracellulare]MCA2253867.1 hypothetical protein [Mycobacterium intracellulare]